MTRKKDKYAHLPYCAACGTHIAEGHMVTLGGRTYHYRCTALYVKQDPYEYTEGGGI